MPKKITVTICFSEGCEVTHEMDFSCSSHRIVESILTNVIQSVIIQHVTEDQPYHLVVRSDMDILGE